MSDVLLYRLRENREAILEDLESSQVLDYLYQEDVLDSNKYEEVRDKGPRKQQAALLLSYVERDSSAIERMIEALEHSSQRHLACILKEELPDEVQRSKVIRELLLNDPETPYPMIHVPCGYAVIINNYEFDEHTKMEVREGSKVDVDKMEKLFHWLQFEVDLYENQTAAEIESIVRKYQVEVDHNNFDCFVLFLMSHGDTEGIFGTDGKEVSIRHNIRSHLTADKCFSLANKPKLIFVQACRGKKADKPFLVTDSPIEPRGTMLAQEMSSRQNCVPTMLEQSPADYTTSEVDLRYIPQDSDIMIAYAATAEHAALRNVHTGGWFVSQLYDVMRNHAATEDLQSMFTKVVGRVSSRKSSVHNYMQCPEQIGNLRRKVCFKPRKEKLEPWEDKLNY